MAIRNNNTQQNQLMNTGALTMAVDYEVVAQRMQQLQMFVHNYMTPGEDFGTIEGINKPTLLKSGAEKLCDVYGLSAGDPTIEYVRDDSKSPTYISYRIVLPLISRADGRTIMTGVGSCNSHEKKYKWRWAFENELPVGVNPQGLKTRTVGKNGQYTQYQIPNDEVDDLDNTILKMAKKRALVDAVLSATRSSAIFTQDVEDMDIKPINNEKRYEQRQSNNNQRSNQNSMTGPSTDAQRKAIFGSGKNKGLDGDDVKALAKKLHNVDSMNDLTKQQASDMITLFNQSEGDELKSMIGMNEPPEDDPFGGSTEINDDDMPF